MSTNFNINHHHCYWYSLSSSFPCCHRHHIINHRRAWVVLLCCINHLPLVFIIFKMHFLLEHYHVMHELLVNLFLLSKGNVFLGTSCISTLHLTFIVIVVLVPSYFNGILIRRSTWISWIFWFKIGKAILRLIGFQHSPFLAYRASSISIGFHWKLVLT